MSTGQAAWREEGGRWGSPEDGRNPCPSVASGLGSVGVLGIQPFVVDLNVHTWTRSRMSWRNREQSACPGARPADKEVPRVNAARLPPQLT